MHLVAAFIRFSCAACAACPLHPHTPPAAAAAAAAVLSHAFPHRRIAACRDRDFVVEVSQLHAVRRCRHSRTHAPCACPSFTLVDCSVDIAMVPAEAATNEGGGVGAIAAAPSKRVTFSLADVNSLLDRLQV